MTGPDPVTLDDKLVEGYNDFPIEDPSQDRFGMDGFAGALATAILKMRASYGSVIALNGQWGSGKSSVVNLVLRHLRPAELGGQIKILRFNCWWFRGEEQLALAFFRDLYAGIGPTLGDKFKKALPKLGSKILKAGTLVGTVVEAAVSPTAGKITSGASELLEKFIETEETAETEYQRVSDALAAQDRRFLIVIDDIDRLSPEEALLIFRLVKSVGRLPKVTYLLVFDRALAERVVQQHFPSEGAQYLEKIVQASFEIPPPSAADLERQLSAGMTAICGPIPEVRTRETLNLYHDAVLPEMRSPRDVTRYLNTIAVTWPAIAKEVDIGDFIALEALRLFRPKLYTAIRGNSSILLGARRLEGQTAEAKRAELDRLLLECEPAADRSRLRAAIIRLFPYTAGVWSNLVGIGESRDAWERYRLVCSPVHFDTYFRLSLADDALPSAEIDRFIAIAGDSGQVAERLRESVKQKRRNGGTKCASLLEAVRARAAMIPQESISTFITGLFQAADDIEVDDDRIEGFGSTSNSLRIHWLLKDLVRNRLTLEARSAALLEASRTSQLHWLVEFADSAYSRSHPEPGKEARAPDDLYTDSATAECIIALSIERIRTAAQTNDLLNARTPSTLLFHWARHASEEVVRAWTLDRLADADSVRKLAKSLTTYSWSQGLGVVGPADRVAMRAVRVHPEAMKKILDVERFRARLEDLRRDGDEVAAEFLEAWRKHDAGEH